MKKIKIKCDNNIQFKHHKKKKNIKIFNIVISQLNSKIDNKRPVIRGWTFVTGNIGMREVHSSNIII